MLAALALLLAPTFGAIPATGSGAAAADLASNGPTSAHIALRVIVSGLTQPLFVTGVHDGSGRLFIVEKTGKILIYYGGKVYPTPFLSIAGLVSQGTEQGLLGLAFSPDYRYSHKLYVNYTNLSGNTVIREYRASTTNPNVVDSRTARTILTISQPYANHNGGMLAFGPDGDLYIGMGDGGSAGDPGNRAQSLNTLLGKMLRINVNGSTSTQAYLVPSTNPFVGRYGLDQIWQYGLRNPWRFSFDKATGNLWIGDVGQSSWEEIDRAVRTASGPGRGINWGWHVLEGTYCYDPLTGCNTAGKTMPIVEYSHDVGRCAVTGGYVYRGTAIPALVGGYLFGDYCTGEIFVMNAASGSPGVFVRLLDSTAALSSFGQDEAGELYVCDLNGAVYKIVQG
ncbi:MAG TPA: PQQ-dependent sugar dehydrogenase [Candidatus Limnocylindrales bacterium]|nr:PQQ-dependent sugar dehydrogenase [Candidatus Limnocylindrales bacterium]